MQHFDSIIGICDFIYIYISTFELDFLSLVLLCTLFVLYIIYNLILDVPDVSFSLFKTVSKKKETAMLLYKLQSHFNEC